ncbi:hypothetical protein HZA98_01510 [Candidatus Woesearchaeota archaeon]|nr:hypothetical protein [Candidatus Woesearchaeota archaeon]
MDHQKRRQSVLMVNLKSLLELRKAINAKKPTFLRQDAHRNKSLEKKWRKPNGLHSKIRLKMRGRRVMPSPGYASPRLVRGLTREGLVPHMVNNLKDLAHFDPKTEIVVIAHVGAKKKVAILKVCLEKKYPISRLKAPEAFVKKVEDTLALKKKKQKESEEKKKKSKEESLKKAKETKEEEKKETPAEEGKEETKKGEKSDKIKVLEKKQ